MDEGNFEINLTYRYKTGFEIGVSQFDDSDSDTANRSTWKFQRLSCISVWNKPSELSLYVFFFSVKYQTLRKQWSFVILWDLW
jgi:hypothetical protein